MGEFDLIKEISQMFKTRKKGLWGIGDDCAVVKSGNKFLLYTIDSMVENIHFNIKLGINWYDVGYKSLVRSISDIAAMGGDPKFVLLALAMKSKKNMDFFELFLKGFEEAANEYKVSLIGGDITEASAFSASIAIIGESSKKPIFRKGAKVGDIIFLSGYTGLASAGLFLLQNKKKNKIDELVNAYSRPKARVVLGKAILKQSLATSMIDISDGLLGDLQHIAYESNVGAVIDINRLPVHECFKKLSFTKKNIMNFILNGGDDYELLFTVSPEKVLKIEALSKKTSVKITKIGYVVESGIYLKENKRLTPAKVSSYEHFN